MSRYVFLTAIGLGMLLLAVSSALADDAIVEEIEIFNMGPDGNEVAHDPDLDPWKGWFWMKIVRNKSWVSWGDFHFELRNISGCGDSNVVFTDDFGPLSSQTFSSDPVISDGGKTLDLYFYDDPIVHNDWGWFKIWTDNTNNHNSFKVFYYPTPVPEPATLTLLGLGGLALIRRRRS